MKGRWNRRFTSCWKGKCAFPSGSMKVKSACSSTSIPGDFFGEMAIVNNAPRAATVATTCDSTVLELRKEIFADMLEQSSSISIALMREVSRRLRENDEIAIGDLRTKARELAEAYQQLSDLEEARREFLTAIAHELRTPLMAANGFLQVIQSGMLHGEPLNSAIETVHRNLQDITALTNDILFLQEMDLILPEFKLTDIGSLVSSVVEQQRAHAAKNEVGIRISILPRLPQIMADAKSLNRAMVAILDNAIKFSPDGGDVLVEAGYDEKTVWVKIQDQGVGIPPEVIRAFSIVSSTWIMSMVICFAGWAWDYRSPAR